MSNRSEQSTNQTGCKTSPQSDDELSENYKTTRELKKANSLFEELREDENTGHSTNLMLWTVAISAISAATGYVAAFMHVASDTEASWDTLMSLDGLVMATLLGSSGVLMLVFMLGITFAHEIEYQEDE